MFIAKSLIQSQSIQFAQSIFNPKSVFKKNYYTWTSQTWVKRTINNELNLLFHLLLLDYWYNNAKKSKNDCQFHCNYYCQCWKTSRVNYICDISMNLVFEHKLKNKKINHTISFVHTCQKGWYSTYLCSYLCHMLIFYGL